MKLLILLAFSFVLLNCTRKKSETSTVTIQLPTTSQQSSTLSEKISILTYTPPTVNAGATVSDLSDVKTSDSDAWSTINPASVNDTAMGPVVNCYAVFVGSVDPLEAGMKVNYCGKKDAAGNYIETSKLYFGHLAGIYPAPTGVTSNSTAVVSLQQSAIGRKFYLVGFHSTDTTKCVDVAQNFSKSVLSRPHLVGESEATIITGSEVSVSIPMSFNATKFYDDCYVPLYGTNPLDRVASTIEIVKNEFPAGAAVQGGCYPLRFYALNADSKKIAPNEDVIVFVRRTNGAYSLTEASINNSLSTAGSAMDTFDTLSNCTIDAGDGSFEFAKDHEYVDRWARLSTPTGTVDYLKTFPTGLLPSAIQAVRLVGASTDIYDIAGPKTAHVEDCIPYGVYMRDFSGAYLLPGGSGGSSFRVENLSTATNKSTIHSDSACSAAHELSSTSPVSFSNGSEMDLGYFYIKFKGENYERQIIKVSYDSGMVALASFLPIWPVGGDSGAYQLSIQGNTEHIYLGPSPGGYSACTGPYFITSKNREGANVKNGNTAKNIDVEVIGGSGVAFYTGMNNGASCTGGINAVNGKYPINIPANSYIGKFYIKMSYDSGREARLLKATFGDLKEGQITIIGE